MSLLNLFCEDRTLNELHVLGKLIGVMVITTSQNKKTKAD